MIDEPYIDPSWSDEEKAQALECHDVMNRLLRGEHLNDEFLASADRGDDKTNAVCDHKWVETDKRGNVTYFRCVNCSGKMSLRGEPKPLSSDELSSVLLNQVSEGRMDLDKAAAIANVQAMGLVDVKPLTPLDALSEATPAGGGGSMPSDPTASGFGGGSVPETIIFDGQMTEDKRAALTKEWKDRFTGMGGASLVSRGIIPGGGTGGEGTGGSGRVVPVPTEDELAAALREANTPSATSADDVAAEWEAMLAGADDADTKASPPDADRKKWTEADIAKSWEDSLRDGAGREDHMLNMPKRESTRVLNQDEIDSLLGFDEPQSHPWRWYYLRDVKIWFELTPFLWHWAFRANSMNAWMLIGPIGIGASWP